MALFILLGNIAGFYSVPYIASQFAAGLFGTGLMTSVVPFVPVVSVAALFGAQFPLISHYGVEPDELAGSRLSILYLSNILGSVLPLLTGFVLLDRFSIAETTVILTSLGVVRGHAVHCSHAIVPREIWRHHRRLDDHFRRWIECRVGVSPHL